jgi:hypothetical protein
MAEGKSWLTFYANSLIASSELLLSTPPLSR